MTKRDLVVRISKETGLTQQAVFAIVQKTLDIIINERQGINPNHPDEKITIPAKKVVTFKQGKKMKEFVH